MTLRTWFLFSKGNWQFGRNETYRADKPTIAAWSFLTFCPLLFACVACHSRLVTSTLDRRCARTTERKGCTLSEHQEVAQQAEISGWGFPVKWSKSLREPSPGFSRFPRQTGKGGWVGGGGRSGLKGIFWGGWAKSGPFFWQGTCALDKKKR